MTDDQPDLRQLQRDGPELERPAVEQDRVIGDATGRRELVHDAGLDADVGVLRPAADAGAVTDGNRGSVRSEQRQGRRHLERGRRRQARSLRQVASQDRAEPTDGISRILERPGSAPDVIDPAARCRPDRVEVERAGFAGLLVRREDCEPDLQPDRCWHHKPIVVVRMLTDEVHPAGRTNDLDVGRRRARRQVIEGPQALSQSIRIQARVHHRQSIARRIAPKTTSAAEPSRRSASARSAASRSRNAPQPDASTIADSRSGATAVNGATVNATRISR